MGLLSTIGAASGRAFGFTRSVITTATDAFFNRVTLLLPGNGTNGAQNNTFLDSSANAFTITRNGNTTQGTFTPFSATGWGNFFNGSTDYLSNLSNALVTSSTTTFTVEVWVYLTANPPANGNGISAMCSLDGQPTGPTNYLSFGPMDDRKLKLFWFDGAVKNANGATALNLNTWNHIACVVNSNAIQFYVNGVADTMSGTTTLTNRSGSQNNFSIGSSSAGYITGYLSNFRVTTTAVYTTGFNPSTVPLTAITNTRILTCQSNRFVDNSTNAFSLTVNGTPSVQAVAPFAPQFQYTPTVIGGSGFFDGSGDYLTTPSDAALSFGTGDFSEEFWIYLTTTPATFQRPLQYSDDRDNIVVESGNFNFFDGSASTISAATTGQWFHLCVTRVSGTLRGFVNGRLGFTRSGTYNSGTRSLALGATSGGANPLGGYTSNYRIVKGGIPSAYSTSSTTVGAQIFTPPTAPFTGSESLTAGSVSLLLNFTNAGITDATSKNVLETVGNAQISTSVVKYGSGSMAFDGSGDYLIAPDSENFRLGTGNFTIEFWINASASGTYNQVIGTLTSGTEEGTWRIGNRFNSTNSIYFARGTGSGFNEIVYTVNVNDGVWHHVACVRNNGVIFMYVDGVAQTASSGSTSIAGTCSSANRLWVGYNGRDNAYLTGYLDDVRVTKGIARYTANFTPPTAALPLQ